MAAPMLATALFLWRVRGVGGLGRRIHQTL